MTREDQGNEDGSSISNAELARVVAELRRQIADQNILIARLTAEAGSGNNNNNNQHENEHYNDGGRGGHQETGWNELVRREPLLITWKKAHPEDFEGGADPLKARDWLKKVEGLAEGLELRDNEKVKCASYSLTMSARTWWETVKQRVNTATMTWEQFSREFNDKYLNPSRMTKFWDELHALTQGSMDVLALATRLTDLLQLCPTAAPTEEDKTRIFLRALRPEIAVHVRRGNATPDTLTECVNVATQVEYYVSALQTSVMTSSVTQRPSTQNSGGGQSQGWERNKKRPYSESSGKGSSFTPSRQEKIVRHPLCNKCGRNHPGQCRFGGTTCYICGQEGHFARSCPRRGQPQSSGGKNIASSGAIHHMQGYIEGPSIQQGRLEAPPEVTTARVYTLTREEASQNPNVVTGNE
ncbi:unnamed protein product [Cuscuta epithymum]|uniref:CCHC-type domain-containing protein n=1 Tax=Cuscuta epithymum TaxID=186058 RepID=A0AAV0CK18_9ASTE|nr:unnamed protein product [Cuscuta epithymum]